MGTFHRFKRRRRRKPLVEKPRLSFGEQAKLARELVRSGNASDLKEAWAILKENGTI